MTAPTLNGPLEVGLRALTLLSAAFPRAFDIASLSFLDYTLLHSREFGGPESLHPDVPNHQSEITVKRNMLEHGLEVMIRARLVSLRVEPGGIAYAATDNAPGFVGLLESEYMQELRRRAEWVLESFGDADPAVLRSLIASLGGVDNFTPDPLTAPEHQGDS
ncbi:ABC-three component system middle component 2 [Micromonospora sp. NPDC005189]|uniref:ABC-three component system middle component 2 n=1 Tax=unclassified Micromonospora TaxID=2617518 RepID=UPI0033B39355